MSQAFSMKLFRIVSHEARRETRKTKQDAEAGRGKKPTTSGSKRIEYKFVDCQGTLRNGRRSKGAAAKTEPQRTENTDTCAAKAMDSRSPLRARTGH